MLNMVSFGLAINHNVIQVDHHEWIQVGMDFFIELP